MLQPHAQSLQIGEKLLRHAVRAGEHTGIVQQVRRLKQSPQGVLAAPDVPVVVAGPADVLHARFQGTADHVPAVAVGAEIPVLTLILQKGVGLPPEKVPEFMIPSHAADPGGAEHELAPELAPPVAHPERVILLIPEIRPGFGEHLFPGMRALHAPLVVKIDPAADLPLKGELSPFRPVGAVFHCVWDPILHVPSDSSPARSAPTVLYHRPPGSVNGKEDPGGSSVCERKNIDRFK